MENCENLVNKLEYIPVECICVLSNDELIWKKSAVKKPIVGVTMLKAATPKFYRTCWPSGIK